MFPFGSLVELRLLIIDSRIYIQISVFVYDLTVLGRSLYGVLVDFKKDGNDSLFLFFLRFFGKKNWKSRKWTKINVQIRIFKFFFCVFFEKKRMRLKCRDLKIKKKNFVTIKFFIKNRIPKTASFV